MRTKRMWVNRTFCVLASVIHRVVVITAVLALPIPLLTIPITIPMPIPIILIIINISIPHIINRNRLCSRPPSMPATVAWAWLPMASTANTAIQKTS